MSYFTNTTAGTQELFDNSLLIPQIANYYDWSRLRNNSQFFAVMNNTGNITPTGDTELTIVDETDLTHKFELAAAQVVDIPALNSESTAFINLNTIAGITGLNGVFQVGDAFLIRGQADTVAGGRTATDHIDAIVRVTDVNSSGHVKFTTLYITPLSGTSYPTARLGKVSTTTNMTTVFLNYKIDEYDGDAPNPESIRPSFYYNYMQMFRRPYGKGIVEASHTTKYDNSIEYLGLMEMDQLMMQMSRALLFSQWGRPAAATSYHESVATYADGGTGNDYGVMMGIPGFLGTNSLSASSQCIYQVDTGTGVDFWNLRNWANSFTTGNTLKYGITSPTFADKIARAAYAVGYRPMDGVIEFPRWKWQYQEYNLGAIQLRLIVDRNLEWMTPKVYDSVNSRTVAQKNLLFAIDPQYFKMFYHQNKYLGVMAPGVYDIDTTNGSHKKKKEVKSAFSCMLSHKSAHGVYGITNA